MVCWFAGLGGKWYATRRFHNVCVGKGGHCLKLIDGFALFPCLVLSDIQLPTGCARLSESVSLLCLFSFLVCHICDCPVGVFTDPTALLVRVVDFFFNASVGRFYEFFFCFGLKKFYF